MTDLVRAQGRRLRAAGFAVAAAACAALAAAAAGSGGEAELHYGPLREVVVSSEALPAGRVLDRKAVDEALALRRVPESFVPPGSLTLPAEALGRVPAVSLPAGSYLLASQLRSDTPSRPHEARLSGRRTAVEVTVQGGAALTAYVGSPVAVVVTTEPRAAGPGRTYVAAPAVKLLDLRATSADTGAADVLGRSASEPWIATLAVSRHQALRLIQAESFARSIRLIGEGGG